LALTQAQKPHSRPLEREVGGCLAEGQRGTHERATLCWPCHLKRIQIESPALVDTAIVTGISAIDINIIII